jgi:lipid-A-disaccharide synthase-like uncharacterized protein
MVNLQHLVVSNIFYVHRGPPHRIFLHLENQHQAKKVIPKNNYVVCILSASLLITIIYYIYRERDTVYVDICGYNGI